MFVLFSCVFQPTYILCLKKVKVFLFHKAINCLQPKLNYCLSFDILDLRDAYYFVKDLSRSNTLLVVLSADSHYSDAASSTGLKAAVGILAVVGIVGIGMAALFYRKLTR